MKQRKRFGKTDWLSLGLGQLAREGSAGLTVEALCEAADRTRGSFYHHFSDHGAFIEALMEAWKQRNTHDVAEETLLQAPNDRARKLSDLASGLDQDLERAVRQFAQGNATALRAVREVDELRTGFLAKLYEGSGLEPGFALEIARIEYAAFVGVQVVWPDMPEAERQALERRFAGLVKSAVRLPSRPD
ncbi:TetR/AcrR family transcriptional regulator [Roseibium sp.]|uniref:TetR/AcrR family transcriptional regulator n=1 Tax=Roseibium sp. TaxID=1936156 RepID=UPI003D130411